MKRSQDTTEIRPVMHASLIVLALTLLLAVPQQIMAQSRVGTSAAVFLTLGNGARASALGHAYTATSRGADALFWNPSGSAIRQDNLAGGAGVFEPLPMVCRYQYQQWCGRGSGW